jgi:hypothetical protein
LFSGIDKDWHFAFSPEDQLHFQKKPILGSLAALSKLTKQTVLTDVKRKLTRHLWSNLLTPDFIIVDVSKLSKRSRFLKKDISLLCKFWKVKIG